MAGKPSQYSAIIRMPEPTHVGFTACNACVLDWGLLEGLALPETCMLHTQLYHINRRRLLRKTGRFLAATGFPGDKPSQESIFYIKRLYEVRARLWTK